MTRNTLTTTTRTHQLTLNGKPATDAEYHRVMSAKPKASPDIVPGTLSSNRSFRLLR
jgi:hypothetical protein